jgi:hypothetical protein
MGDFIEIWQGGILYYADDQLDAIKEALVKFQQKNDTKAEVMVILSYSSSSGSSQVCFVMMASLLVQTDFVNSFCLLSFIFMTLPLLREYLMISWLFPLPRGMSQQRHSTT